MSAQQFPSFRRESESIRAGIQRRKANPSPLMPKEETSSFRRKSESRWAGIQRRTTNPSLLMPKG